MLLLCLLRFFSSLFSARRSRAQVWDVIEDQEAVELVRPIDDPKEASNLLVRRSLEKGSTDNITAMVIRFRWVANAADPTATPEASRTQQGKIDTVDVTTHH